MSSLAKNNLINLLFIIGIFFVDRLTKFYILNLSENGAEVDFYVFSFLNIYLIWNKGVGFGLFSFDSQLFYHITSFIIVLIILYLIYLFFYQSRIRKYFISSIIGGALGNLFDRFAYFAVPDFFDLHYNDYHWFVFNLADIFITLGLICLIFAEFVFKNQNKENYEKQI